MHSQLQLWSTFFRDKVSSLKANRRPFGLASGLRSSCTGATHADATTGIKSIVVARPADGTAANAVHGLFTRDPLRPVLPAKQGCPKAMRDARREGYFGSAQGAPHASASMDDGNEGQVGPGSRRCPHTGRCAEVPCTGDWWTSVVRNNTSLTLMVTRGHRYKGLQSAPDAPGKPAGPAVGTCNMHQLWQARKWQIAPIPCQYR